MTKTVPPRFRRDALDITYNSTHTYYHMLRGSGASHAGKRQHGVLAACLGRLLECIAFVAGVTSAHCPLERGGHF